MSQQKHAHETSTWPGKAHVNDPSILLIVILTIEDSMEDMLILHTRAHTVLAAEEYPQGRGRGTLLVGVGAEIGEGGEGRGEGGGRGRRGGAEGANVFNSENNGRIRWQPSLIGRMS